MTKNLLVCIGLSLIAKRGEEMGRGGGGGVGTPQEYGGGGGGGGGGRGGVEDTLRICEWRCTTGLWLD